MILLWIVLITFLLLTGGFCIYYLVIYRLRLLTTHEFQKIKADNDVLNQTNTSLQQVLEDYKQKNSILKEALKTDRKRIALELHDDTIQCLAGIRFRLEQLSYYRLPTRAEEEIHLLRKELGEIIGDIRLLVTDLVHPKFERNSFSYLIKNLAGKFKKVLHRKVELQIIDENREFFLTPGIKKELFSMVQEAAQNSLNCSTGLLLKITVSWTSRLCIMIADDGQGLLARGQGKGFGMESLRKRAEAINAKLTVHSSYPGLTIFIELEEVSQTNPLR